MGVDIRAYRCYRQTFRMKPKTASYKSTMKTILQTEASECSLACLVMIARHFGYECDLTDVRRKFPLSLKGSNLSQLMQHASAMNLMGRPLRLELDEISELKLPCILHWNLNHFVVLKSVKKNYRGRLTYTVLDPAIGQRKISAEKMSESFTGIALELDPSSEFRAIKKSKRVSISELTGKIRGLRSAVVQVIILALALEIFAVATPLFNQFIIDEVVVAGDRELLKVLAVGFILLLITQNAIGLARSWFVMRWSMDISLQWSVRIFSHLLNLPVHYFEKRHLGDVLSRFESIGAIQSTLTGVFIGSLLDGIMAIIAIAMMFLYSQFLSLVVLFAVVIYAGLRWALYRPFREASEERLIMTGKESSHFLESLRAIMPIKLFGKEADRIARWMNLRLNVQNRDVRTQKLGIIFQIGNASIFGLQAIAVFYVGAQLVIDNIFTIGMLFAFTSYSATFTDRVAKLIDMGVGIKMLSLHAERLADIALEPREDDSIADTELHRIVPKIELRNVSFRYGDGEPWILRGVNLVIMPGENVALTGPSGSGKTTLCKILLGILHPTEGDVLVGGIAITQLGLANYRRLVGTVMQEDTLLSGSVAENISFYDHHQDMEHIIACAIHAAVHNEITSMPMGYQTLVGDMGSSLSGGQKQRILLARALYKRPRILSLDEATSHLDIDNEMKVTVALKSLGMTQIMVAHRPDTICTADRVLVLNQGLLVQGEKSRPAVDKYLYTVQDRREEH